MNKEIVSQGSLFTSDFLTESVQDLAEWTSLDPSDLEAFKTHLQHLLTRFPTDHSPNESQTEDDLIWPILEALGWTDSLRQQNLSLKGREDVPDGLMFESAEVKAKANSFPEEWKRYGFGRAVVEAKRWGRPLDRRSGKRGEETAPSSQMLRYLRRIDDITGGNLRWGILTNGAKWRLYFAGARSVSEQFFEIDLATILDVPGHDAGLFAISDDDKAHWLTVFYMIFRREAFVPVGADRRTFHEKALEEGRVYEERVAEDLSNKVFGQVFPDLVQAIVKAEPTADLQEVREAALILLYRLLFILYAEDRDLLPVRDSRYDDYGLRQKIRFDVKERKDRNDTFSDQAARYWSSLTDLFIAIDQGDTSIGLPPYNGGLFDQERHKILTKVRIPDSVMAQVIDAMSFEQTPDGRKYINYRNLSVQQLGSIYERLLEYEVVQGQTEIRVRPNTFARKGSGSYYTPDDLVQFILNETLEPLIEERKEAFRQKVAELADSNLAEHRKMSLLKTLDPATRLLDLKICDPAMGSGHFLVSLVDFLTDHVIRAMAEAEQDVPSEWGDYISPLGERIETIRGTILTNADERKWTVDEDQLDDRHIIRRMVLKRCVYGVDKNAMAVELAKVALWLHTFTVGAPLSFLDHHLRCGDSLFGSWVKQAIDKAATYGTPLLLHEPIKRSLRAASKMQIVEGLTDAEIAEAHRSADVFAEIEEMTAPLDALLKFIHALNWIDVKDRSSRAALKIFFDGQFGDPLAIVLGKTNPKIKRDADQRFSEILAQARMLMAEENFLNWQVAFPGVWASWESDTLDGGFDAIIGNPPWDRMKLQQVEWFAERRPEIAQTSRASDRKAMIAALKTDADPLAQEYAKAADRAETAITVARKLGDYPLLSGGDINLYSLFVERAHTLTAQNGMIGLLVPIGIGTDKTSAKYVANVTSSKKLKSFVSFENKRRWLFKDVHSEDQPTVIVLANTENTFEKIRYAVKLHSLPTKDNNLTVEIDVFTLSAVNPNTGTLPIFRSPRDAKIVSHMYGVAPVFIRRKNGEDKSDWSCKYRTMFHMTNDSEHFKTKKELLENENAWPIGQQRYQSDKDEWFPLYEGKSIQIYNHRYASIVTPAGSVSGQGQAVRSSDEQLSSSNHLTEPRYWVPSSEMRGIEKGYAIGFNDVCNTNNERSLIAAMVPRVGTGNTLPLLDGLDAKMAALLLANLNSIPCDYVARNKIQSRHLNKYILEQLPIIPPKRFQSKSFGHKTAAQVVQEAVLELTYTAQDMAQFASDMGHLDASKDVPQPFVWDRERRLALRAKLDSVFFHLYEITDREDIRFVYSTFPKVQRDEEEAYDGVYRSQDLCLAWFSALAAGQPDADIRL